MYARTPVYQISASDQYSPLVTFLETVLTMIWYPSCVATIARRVYETLQDAFEESCDDTARNMIDGMLVNFGYSAVSGSDQAVLGGCAQLLSFTSSAVSSAVYYAQHSLNKGKHVGNCLPVLSEDAMLAYETPADALKSVVSSEQETQVLCMIDAEDVSDMIATIAAEQLQNNVILAIHFETEDIAAAVLNVLRALKEAFGYTTNTKGFTVLSCAGIMVRDVDMATIELLSGMHISLPCVISLLM